LAKKMAPYSTAAQEAASVNFQAAKWPPSDQGQCGEIRQHHAGPDRGVQDIYVLSAVLRKTASSDQRVSAALSVPLSNREQENGTDQRKTNDCWVPFVVGAGK